MNTANATSTPKIIWINIVFFAVTALVSLIGAPLYFVHFGLRPWNLCLTLFYMAATGMSITVGYHRCFSHVTFKAHPFIQFFFLFFGAAAFEQSALRWSSQHRDHHRYVDTDMDPYNIKKGFFYAHIGWLLFWKHTVHYENVKDLQKNPMVMHQHQYYVLWAIGSGILMPVLIGLAFGDMLGAFIFAVCARLVFVHHATFCINSVCHMVGKATYDIYSTAKDHWLVAFLTNGEGYHNFHHRFPSDYRNGVRWYQWDPSKWFIALLRGCRLAWDLKKVSKFRILEARIKADQQRIRDWMCQVKEPSRWERFHGDLELRYKVLHERLAAWEQRSKEYRALLCGRIRKQSKVIADFAHRKMKVAKQRFKQEREQWQLLIKSQPSLAPLI